MEKVRIVIATNNGSEHLKKCIDSLGGKYPILVVDTGSTDREHLDYVKTLDYGETDGYSHGAFMWAYNNRPAQNYLFLQDSMVALVDDVVKPFQELMPEKGAVAWAKFGWVYDGYMQREWVESQYGNTHPPQGIFGPIFYTSHRTLNSLKNRGLLPKKPTNKEEAQGSERAWAFAFHNANFPIESVCGMWDKGSMSNGTFPIFQKTFADRR